MSRIQWTKSGVIQGRIWANNGLAITDPGYVSVSIDGIRNSTELRVWFGGDTQPSLIKSHDGRAIAKEIAEKLLQAVPAGRRPTYHELDHEHARHSIVVYLAAVARLRAEHEASR